MRRVSFHAAMSLFQVFFVTLSKVTAGSRSAVSTSNLKKRTSLPKRPSFFAFFLC
jgi:hypothetical protein